MAFPKEFDEHIAQVEVAYIGAKPTKTDTVANTGVVWEGFGDVQTVDARAASLLLKFKTVWVKPEQVNVLADSLQDQVDAEEEKERLAEEAAKLAAEEEAAKLNAEIDAGNSANAGQDEQTDTAAKLKVEQIQAAILGLDQSNTDHFTTKGAPKVNAVSLLMPEGVEVTSAEIATAFAEMGGE